MPEVGCSEGNVRLDSRDSDSTGRVEVCLDNTWRSICSSSWDNNDALVVCRQLDHTGGTYVYVFMLQNLIECIIHVFLPLV